MKVTFAKGLIFPFFEKLKIERHKKNHSNSLTEYLTIMFLSNEITIEIEDNKKWDRYRQILKWSNYDHASEIKEFTYNKKSDRYIPVT